METKSKFLGLLLLDFYGDLIDGIGNLMFESKKFRYVIVTLILFALLNYLAFPNAVSEAFLHAALAIPLAMAEMLSSILAAILILDGRLYCKRLLHGPPPPPCVCIAPDDYNCNTFLEYALFGLIVVVCIGLLGYLGSLGLVAFQIVPQWKWSLWCSLGSWWILPLYALMVWLAVIEKR